ncbi:MAG TPA: hypothetical protein VN033_14235, partial [Vulgatibacter sp.]|nr:hypothetical protein [Vulgatibacter sp.]
MSVVRERVRVFVRLSSAVAAVLALVPSAAWAQTYSVELQPHTYQPLPIGGGTKTEHPYPSQFGGVGYAPYQMVINLPFTVPFFGVDYDTVTVMGNGSVQFGVGTFTNSTTDAAMDNRVIPSTSGTYHNFVAVWRDKVVCQGAGGPLATQYLGQPGSRQLVIEWNNCRRYASSGEFTAQLWLTENDPTIEVHYGFLGTSAQNWVAGMGIENFDGTDGTPGLGLDGTVCTPNCTPADFPAGHRLIYASGPSVSLDSVDVVPQPVNIGYTADVSALVTNNRGKDLDNVAV